jgi:hypothetical protein
VVLLLNFPLLLGIGHRACTTWAVLPVFCFKVCFSNRHLISLSLGWPQTTIRLPLPSQVTEIISIYHYIYFIFWGRVSMTFYLSVFDNTGIWTQSFVIARQYSTTKVMPQVILWLFWRQGLAFCPHLPGPRPSYFSPPVIAGITGVYHHTQIFSHTFLA